MNKLKVIMIILLACFYISFGQLTFAESHFFNGKKYNPIVEKGLEYLIYNPQGKSPDGKAVYIMAGAMCPFTQKIMRAKDKIQALNDKGIQIRWVFPKTFQYNPEQVLYLAEEPLPDAFNDFFQGARKASSREQDVISSLNNVIANASENLGGFPSISYKTAKGMKYTNSIDDILKEADKIMPIADKSAITRKYAEEILARDFDEPVKVKNNSKKPIHGYALPDLNSTVLNGKGRFILKPGQKCQDTCYDFNDEFYICKIQLGEEVNFYFYQKS